MLACFSCEKMLKSPSDSRTYRYLTLPRNGLRCVLVSDPDTDKAAAAMSVRNPRRPCLFALSAS